MIPGATHMPRDKPVQYAACYRCGRIFSLGDYARCPECRASGQALRSDGIVVDEASLLNQGFIY